MPRQSMFDPFDLNPIKHQQPFEAKKQPSTKKNQSSSFSDVWNDNGLDWSQSYLNIIDVMNINDYLGKIHYSHLAIITKSPLPQINPIEIFLEGKPLHIPIIPSKEPLENISSEQLLKIFKFTKRFLFELLDKKVLSEIDEFPYLLAPLTALSYNLPTTFQSVAIDWYSVEQSIILPILQEIDTDNLIICDTANLNSCFYYSKTHYHLNPLSYIPITENKYSYQSATAKKSSMTFSEYYLKILKKEVKKLKQPVLEVQRVTFNFDYLSLIKLSSTKKSKVSQTDYILPEFCTSYFFTASVLRSLMLIPSLMTRINALLRIRDVKIKLGLPEIKDELLLEAFTFTTANLAMNYERLELLGDSFLKFIATLDVSIRFPQGPEGLLNSERNHIVSNNTMYKAAIKKNLLPYFITQPFDHQAWTIPNVIFDDNVHSSKDNTVRTNDQVLGGKRLADVIEASIGASLLSSGSSGALKSAIAFGIPLKKALNWEEFYIYAYILNIGPAKSSLEQDIDICAIEEKIGYTFLNKAFLTEIFIYSSYPRENSFKIQILEFLGDAILDYFVVTYLFIKHPKMSPGDLTEMKGACVSNVTLAAIMEILQLFKLISHFSHQIIESIEKAMLNMAQSRKDWEGNKPKQYIKGYWFDIDTPKIISSTLKSIIGAVFVDSGFSIKAPLFIFKKSFQPLYDQHIIPYKATVHPFIQLTNFFQRFGCLKLDIDASTLDSKIANIFDPEFRSTCTVTLHNHKLGRGTGATVKSARKSACQNAINYVLSNQDLLGFICDCPKKSRGSS